MKMSSTTVTNRSAAKKALANNPEPDEPETPTTIDSTSSQSPPSNGDPVTRFSQNSPAAIIRKCFKCLGEFSACQPWQVLVVTLVLLVVILHSLSNFSKEHLPILQPTWVEQLAVVGASLLGILRLSDNWKKIMNTQSRLICLISAIYILVSWVLFTIVSWCFGLPVLRNPFYAWYFIPLMTDMQKVSRMAQFALSSSHSRRISENVANGMYVLGPTLALDTVAGTLLFSLLGLQLGFQKLEIYAWYAIISVWVNMMTFITFYPSGLSIALNLMLVSDGRPIWNVREIINSLPNEEGRSPSVHKVTVISTTVLLIFHIIWLPIFAMDPNAASAGDSWQWLKINFWKAVLVILTYIGCHRFLYHEEMDEGRELRRTYIEELTKKFAEDSNDVSGSGSRTTKEETDTNSTDSGLSLKPRPSSNRGTDDSGSESAWSEFLNEFKDQEVQTTENFPSSNENEQLEICSNYPPRSADECLRILRADNGGAKHLTDEEVIQLVEQKMIRGHTLEKELEDNKRGVAVRRKLVENKSGKGLTGLPYVHYDYDPVMGACCESVIGYMTLPVGVAGPLRLDGQQFYVPMATTEGCLVASVNRGCNALSKCGVVSVVTRDGMSRAPIVRFQTISQMAQAKEWMEEPENFKEIKKHFDSTSRFARLQRLDYQIAGHDLYIRFVAKTGDAMGMNMISKATEHSLKWLQDEIFPEMEIISLSGNFCTDKKPASVNWLNGRGKSVICEATVPGDVVQKVLKTTPEALVKLNESKNLVGSALAGSIGGFNAQAANVVTAIYIATGQDAAQNVASSNCLTQMQQKGDDLYVTVTMPSIEVGTVGGGTILTAQGTCLSMLGVKGSHPTTPGENATQLARIVCATVLAGELSLMSALAAGHLVRSHLRHNRSHLAIGNCIHQQPTIEDSNVVPQSMSANKESGLKQQPMNTLPKNLPQDSSEKKRY